MLTLDQIITEVDTLIPNPFDTSKKVGWLNLLNKEFLEIVKIPAIYQFYTIDNQSIYTLPNEIKSQNIKKVMLKNTVYYSMQYEEVKPGHNYWIFDDISKSLSLNPVYPSSNNLVIVRYNKSSITTFSINNLTVTPDAPNQYHFAFVFGLAELIAKAMNDVTLANNYGNDYRGQLLIAQQNYANRGNEVETIGQN